MAYNNFKAKIWANEIMTDLTRNLVFGADCVTKYSGSITNKGDTVRIPGVAKPTITSFAANQKVTLSSPEEVADTSVSVVADHVETFNFGVDDIDQAQGADGLVRVLTTEASEEMANKIDAFLGGLSANKQAVKLYSAGTTPWTISTSNVLTVIDTALEKLYENDVNPSTTITITVSPKFFTIFRQAYIKLDTDNSAMLKNGKVAQYGNAIIRMSNNVYKDSNSYDFIQVKTQRALALVKSTPHVEPYRVESQFTDAVKGFVIYGGQIIRPKEMVNIVATY